MDTRTIKTQFLPHYFDYFISTLNFRSIVIYANVFHYNLSYKVANKIIAVFKNEKEII